MEVNFVGRQFTHASRHIGAQNKNQKFKFRQNFFANVVSDFFLNCPIRPLMWVILIDIFSVCDILQTQILIFSLDFEQHKKLQETEYIALLLVRLWAKYEPI